MADVIQMYEGESLLIDVDFSSLFRSGETIASVDSVTIEPTGPTLGTPSSSGTIAQFRVSGISSGVNYLLTVQATSDLANIRKGFGVIEGL